MKLNNLPKITARGKKRLGQGLGSGKGKTAGRGQKGQKARGKVALGFIGGTLPLYKKLPFRKGLGNPKISTKPVTVPLSRLAIFKKEEKVNVESIVARGIVSLKKIKKNGVKIMGDGDLTVALEVNLPVSKSAAAKIEGAGGKVV